MDLQPSAPPLPYTRSITVTKPTTIPSSSHTGSVKNLFSCIICIASNTVISGVTDSGFGVITLVTSVSSKGSSFATQRDIMSLKPKIPTNSPSSTTSAALRASAIFTPASRTFVPGLTIVAGLPASRLRKVGEAFPPNACSINGPNNICIAAAWVPPAPCRLAICLIMSPAASLLFTFAFSSLLIVSCKHFPISNKPTMVPSSSTTGKWRKWFSIIVPSASIALSDIDTQVGLEVITSVTHILDGSRYFATTRRVTSVSVNMPARPPFAPTTKDASPRLLASICATDKTLSSTFDNIGFFGRSFDTGTSFFFVVEVLTLTAFFERTDIAVLRRLWTELSSETSSATSMALEKMDLQPSAPPLPYTRSITVTKPTTIPSSSHTGSVKNLFSCIICIASNTVISGVTDSGFGVITLVTSVSSKGSSFATQRDIMSLKPKIPTNSPSSTTSAALRASAIFTPASRTFVPGLTIVAGLPASRLRKVGEAFPPNACSINGPNNICIAAAWVPPAPCRLAICLIMSPAASLLFTFAFSSLLIVSCKHFPISNKPTMVPSSSTTGKWRKWFSIIVPSASIALSDIDTQVGLEVITSVTHILDGSRYFATTRRVTSVSVNMPARPPFAPTTKDASPRLLASICATDKTLSSTFDNIGFFGRSFETGWSFSVLTKVLSDGTEVTLCPPPWLGIFTVVVDLMTGVDWTDKSLASLFWLRPAFKVIDGLVEGILFSFDCFSTGVLVGAGCGGENSFAFSLSTSNIFCKLSISSCSVPANPKSLILIDLSLWDVFSEIFISSSATVGSKGLKASISSIHAWRDEALLKSFTPAASFTNFDFRTISLSNSARLVTVTVSPSSDLYESDTFFVYDSLVTSSLPCIFWSSSFSTFNLFSKASISSWRVPALAKSFDLIEFSIARLSFWIESASSDIVGNKERSCSSSSRASCCSEAFLNFFTAIELLTSSVSSEIFVSRSAREDIPFARQLSWHSPFFSLLLRTDASSFILFSFRPIPSAFMASISLSFALSRAACTDAAPAKSRREVAAANSASVLSTASFNSSIVGNSSLFISNESSFCCNGAHSM